jgi:hypothetical protein
MPSACAYVQVLKQWIGFHEIWYNLHAIGERPNQVILNFLTVSNHNTASARTCEVEATLAPLEYYNYV